MVDAAIETVSYLMVYWLQFLSGDLRRQKALAIKGRGVIWPRVRVYGS